MNQGIPSKPVPQSRRKGHRSTLPTQPQRQTPNMDFKNPHPGRFGHRHTHWRCRKPGTANPLFACAASNPVSSPTCRHCRGRRGAGDRATTTSAWPLGEYTARHAVRYAAPDASRVGHHYWTCRRRAPTAYGCLGYCNKINWVSETECGRCGKERGGGDWAMGGDEWWEKMGLLVGIYKGRDELEYEASQS
jgi:hypothetical protein